MLSLKCRPLLFLLVLLSLSAAYRLASQSQMLSSFDQMCLLVKAKFYLGTPEVNRWLSDCFKAAEKTPFFISRQKLVDRMQDQMDAMGVSHFLIYSQSQDARLWKGQAFDTGLRTKWVQSEMIVNEIIPASPAADAGFHLGDEILEINHHKPFHVTDGSIPTGLYRILRGGQIIHLVLHEREIKIDEAPTLRRISARTGLLRISSFRSEYFSSDFWKQLVRRFSLYGHLIIDVRGNSGGNFVAMLRALSPFFCDPTEIGDLEQPRKDLPKSEGFEDLTQDSYQIEQLELFKEIPLVTFAGYGCFEGYASVLVDDGTASVAEIFAQAFHLRDRSRVMGQPSAGDVVLAVWYDLPSLGEGYSISIPEASFRDDDGRTLEGRGVELDRQINDDLKTWRSGHDPAVVQALKEEF